MSKLDEILLEYGGYCSQQVEATDGDKQFHEAKQAIQALIEEEKNKARIDELNKLSLYRETNDKIDVDFVDWQMIENRLSELKGE